jgi:hypothetical protein
MKDIDLTDYYLDTNLVFNLPKEQMDIIENMFTRLVDSTHGSKSGTISDYGLIYFNTLLKGGYIKNRKVEEREEKIEQING